MMPAVTSTARVVHEEAGSPEGRREAEEAVRHQQEQSDERLRHVLVEHHGGVDAHRQGEAAQNGERQGDPAAAADPMARPLQSGQHRQQHELHHGDVGKDLGPVCQCVGPLTPLPSAKPTQRNPRPGLHPPRPSGRELYPRTAHASAEARLRPFSWTACPDRTPRPAPVGGASGSDAAARYCEAEDEVGVAMTQDWARPVVHWEIEARDPRGPAGVLRRPLQLEDR